MFAIVSNSQPREHVPGLFKQWILFSWAAARIQIVILVTFVPPVLCKLKYSSYSCIWFCSRVYYTTRTHILFSSQFAPPKGSTNCFKKKPHHWKYQGPGERKNFPWGARVVCAMRLPPSKTVFWGKNAKQSSHLMLRKQKTFLRENDDAHTFYCAANR